MHCLLNITYTCYECRKKDEENSAIPVYSAFLLSALSTGRVAFRLSGLTADQFTFENEGDDKTFITSLGNSIFCHKQVTKAITKYRRKNLKSLKGLSHSSEHV